jgi:hypothetical protein
VDTSFYVPYKYYWQSYQEIPDMTLEDLRKSEEYKAVRRSIIMQYLIIFGGILVVGASGCVWVANGNLLMIAPFAVIGIVLTFFIWLTLDEETLSVLQALAARRNWIDEVGRQEKPTDSDEK